MASRNEPNNLKADMRANPHAFQRRESFLVKAPKVPGSRIMVKQHSLGEVYSHKYSSMCISETHMRSRSQTKKRGITHTNNKVCFLSYWHFIMRTGSCLWSHYMYLPTAFADQILKPIIF